MARDTLKGIDDYYGVVVIEVGWADLREPIAWPSKVIRFFFSSITTSSEVSPHGSSGRGAYIRHIPPWLSIRNGQVLQEVLDQGNRQFDRSVEKHPVRESQYDLKTTFDRLDFSNILQETFKIAKERVEAFFEHIRTMDYFAADGRTIGDLLEQFFPGR